MAIESKIYLDMIVSSKVLTNPVTQMCGGNLIIDMKGYKLQTLMAYTIGRVRLLIEILMVCINNCIFFLNIRTYDRILHNV